MIFSPPFNGIGAETSIFFMTLVSSFILLIWYTGNRKSAIESNQRIVVSSEIYYRNLSSGTLKTGLYIILSIIPYIGFIFMFMSASEVGKLKRVTDAINYGLSKPSRRFIVISSLTGLGMFISTLMSIAIFPKNAFPTSFFYINDMKLFWYPIYFTLEIATLVSISTPKIIVSAGIIGTFSLLAFIEMLLIPDNFSTNNFILLIGFTEILIALLFIVNYYSSRERRMNFVKNNKGIGNIPQQEGPVMTAVSSDNEGYKPEFKKSEKPSGNEVKAPQENQNNAPVYRQNLKVETKYDQRDAIAIIGPPAAGKTTFLAYFFHFLRDIEEAINVEADVVNGIELMEEYINRIFTEHKFPELTAKDRVGEVIFQFTKRKRFGSNKIFLRINDIAGETFNSLQGGPENVRRMLTNTRFEYLLKAKGYLVMIDCSSYREWATRDLQYRRIIETILNARFDRKSKPNIAFLFTKTDTLPDAVFKYSAIDLLKLLRNTYAYVSKNIKNPSAFKIYIKTERDQTGEIVPKLDVGVGGMYEIRFDPEVNSGFIFIANWIGEVGEL